MYRVRCSRGTYSSLSLLDGEINEKSAKFSYCTDGNALEFNVRIENTNSIRKTQ